MPEDSNSEPSRKIKRSHKIGAAWLALMLPIGFLFTNTDDHPGITVTGVRYTAQPMYTEQLSHYTHYSAFGGSYFDASAAAGGSDGILDDACFGKFGDAYDLCASLANANEEAIVDPVLIDGLEAVLPTLNDAQMQDVLQQYSALINEAQFTGEVNGPRYESFLNSVWQYGVANGAIADQ